MFCIHIERTSGGLFPLGLGPGFGSVGGVVGGVTFGASLTGPEGVGGVSSRPGGSETTGVLLVGPLVLGPLLPPGVETEGVLLSGEDAGASGTVIPGRVAPWLRFWGLLFTGCWVLERGARDSKLFPFAGFVGGADVPWPFPEPGPPIDIPPFILGAAASGVTMLGIDGEGKRIPGED